MAESSTFLLEWASHTVALKGESEDGIGGALKMRDHVKKCQSFFPPSMEGLDDKMSNLCNAIHAVQKLLSRMDRVCEATMVMALVQGNLDEKIVKVLPQQWQHLVSILQLDFSQEMEDIQGAEADLTVFVQKLDKFEAANSMCIGKFEMLGKDSDLLADKVKTCSEFLRAFVSSLTRASDATKEVSLPPLERFISKYEEIQPSVDKWDLKTVDWIFKEDSEKDVKKDIEDFKQARQDFMDMHASLQKLVSHMDVTQNEELKGGLKMCQSLALDGTKMCDSGAGIAASILFCSCVLVSQSMDAVKKVDGYIKKAFGSAFGLGSLPSKLESQIRTLKDGDTGGNDQDQKKDKKDKKDKKKDKKDKKDQDPTTGSKRASSDVGTEASSSKPKAKKAKK